LIGVAFFLLALSGQAHPWRQTAFRGPAGCTRSHVPPVIVFSHYRPIVRRDGETVRLFTCRGYDWTERYPAIASAAAKLKARSFARLRW
jgi:hypothetical protein